MELAPSPASRLSRRAVLGVAAGAPLLGAKGQETAGAAKKYLDAATEFEILRVTDTANNSWLPIASNRAFTRRGDAVLFASDVSGAPQLYRHDFKANKNRQLTEAAQLNTNTFTWMAGDRTFLYIDGRKVIQPGTGRDRTVVEFAEDWAQSPRLAVGEDGVTVAVSSSNGTRTRIVLAARTTTTLEECDGDIGTLCVRPRRTGVSYVSAGVLRYISGPGVKSKVLKTVAGAEVLAAYWTADGSSLLYLARPAGPGKLTEIRELGLDGGADALVARTSQFAHFQRNGDATVFLGASSSLASPHLLVLLRSVKRELTICEHRCSDARMTRAVFSPNSSRVAFQTDRHGKLVIYAMAVDRLVEGTEDESPSQAV